MAVNPALWTIVNRGITFFSGDAMLTKIKQMRYKDTIKPYTSSRVHSRPKSMARWMGLNPPRKCGTHCSSTMKGQSK
jgi:hypothetical protein